MSVEGDNLVSNPRDGEQFPAHGSSRREDRSDSATAAAIPPRGRGAGRHPREHAQKDRERRGQSDALRSVRDRRSTRREAARSRLQVTVRGEAHEVVKHRSQRGFVPAGVALAIVAALVLLPLIVRTVSFLALSEYVLKFVPNVPELGPMSVAEHIDIVDSPV